jgi:hypothetical protein
MNRGDKLGATLLGAGSEVGRDGIDDDFVVRGFENVGAWILGHNMLTVDAKRASLGSHPLGEFGEV